MLQTSLALIKAPRAGSWKMYLHTMLDFLLICINRFGHLNWCFCLVHVHMCDVHCALLWASHIRRFYTHISATELPLSIFTNNSSNTCALFHACAAVQQLKMFPVIHCMRSCFDLTCPYSHIDTWALCIDYWLILQLVGGASVEYLHSADSLACYMVLHYVCIVSHVWWHDCCWGMTKHMLHT